MVFKKKYPGLNQAFVDYMIEKKLTDIDPNQSIISSNSDWRNLTIRYFGSFTRNQSLYLQTIWKRNQDNIKTEVLSQLQLANNNNNSINIRYPISIWHEWQQYINSTGNRRRFNDSFQLVINNIMQTHNINCRVNRLKSSWFKKDNSRKVNCSFWRGSAHCRECFAEFIFIIDQPIHINDESFLMQISSKNIKQHSIPLKSTLQIKGQLREEAKVELIAKGTQNYRADLINKKKLMNDSTSNLFEMIY
jgi:hypothetical protein